GLERIGDQWNSGEVTVRERVDHADRDRHRGARVQLRDVRSQHIIQLLLPHLRDDGDVLRPEVRGGGRGCEYLRGLEVRRGRGTRRLDRTLNDDLKLVDEDVYLVLGVPLNSRQGNLPTYHRGCPRG